ncbi:MAG: DUF5675 family protein [Mediterranea sp.]|jgi:hypothetical protein|nr:DUF5675 family protein [Mediterranea sp.]
MKTLRKTDIESMRKELRIVEYPEKVLGGSRVAISVNRCFYGDSSTMSYFLVTAYDDNGNAIASLSGMCLEPRVDYDQCDVSGSNTAIRYGTYNVVPSTWHEKSGYFEITGVDGRSDIKIHTGTTGANTTGCLLIGTSGTYNSGTGESAISGDSGMMELFRNFLNQYGDGNATIYFSI